MKDIKPQMDGAEPQSYVAAEPAVWTKMCRKQRELKGGGGSDFLMPQFVKWELKTTTRNDVRAAVAHRVKV